MKWKAPLAWASAALALAGGIAAASPATASPGGGGCTLAGTATFNGSGPGSNPSAAWTYGFTGALTNCNATPGAPAETGGTVSAGEPITFVDQNGATVTEQEPAATGTGSCASSTTSGVSFVQWKGGGVTILQYSTTGAGALVALDGAPEGSSSDGVLAKYTFPDGSVITTTAYAPGDGGVGALAFQPPSPTACTTSTGVTSAGISGFVGLGGS